MMGLMLVLRPLVYLFLFLAGYYFFTKEEVTEYLKSKAVILLVVAGIMGVVECIWYYPDSPLSITTYDYTISCNFIYSAVYAFVAMLALLGIFSRWFDGQNQFTKYMTGRSFGFYFFHYIILMFVGDFVANYLGVSGILRYLLTLLLGVAGTVIVTEICRLIAGTWKKRKVKRLRT